MDKYVLVTGVSTGIGRSCVEQLIKAGYHVAGSVRKKEQALELEEAYGKKFTGLTFDVTDQRGIQEGLELLKIRIGESGSLVAIVNNAGIAVNGPILHVPPSEFEKQFNVNVLGLIRVTQAFVPLMISSRKDNNHPRRVINIGSISGTITMPFLSPYASSKHAVESLSDGMRRELKIHDIGVVLFQPGAILTPIWDKAIKEEGKFMDTEYSSLLQSKSKVISTSIKKALPVEKLTKKILGAIQNKSVKTRYIVMKGKIPFIIFSKWLPDKMVDRMFLKMMMNPDKMKLK